MVFALRHSQDHSQLLTPDSLIKCFNDLPRSSIILQLPFPSFHSFSFFFVYPASYLSFVLASLFHPRNARNRSHVAARKNRRVFASQKQMGRAISRSSIRKWVYSSVNAPWQDFRLPWMYVLRLVYAWCMLQHHPTADRSYKRVYSVHPTANY